MKFAKLNLGQMEAVVNKLGGMRGVNDFLSGRTGIVSLAPWRTITVGLKKTAQQLRDALCAAGRGGDDGRAIRVVWDCIVLGETETIELVMVAIQDFGLPSDADMLQVYARAAELGLGYCPEDTAVEVLLQCGDDYVDDLEIDYRFHFAMDPMSHNGRGYGINRGLAATNGVPLLTNYSNGPNRRRDGEAKFIFVRK